MKKSTFLSALLLLSMGTSRAQWFVASQSLSTSSDDAVSFAVMSDTHFENNTGIGARNKVPRALKSLTSKGALDALFVVGDLSDGGTVEQYNQFANVFSDPANFVNPVGRKVYMMGNHDNYADNAQDNYSSALAVLNNDEPYPLDQYLVINGYPFITISQRSSKSTDGYYIEYGSEAYPEEVCNQLKEWMERAATECPGKPIFVFTHVPPTNTMYSAWAGEGSSNTMPNWSMRPIGAVLAKYPQAVVFSGHSHFPLGDPRSIHQGVDPTSARNNYYTAVGTGSTTYSEIETGKVDVGIHPEGYDQVTEALIVHVKKDGTVVLNRYDTYRDDEMHPEAPWTVKAPYDGSQFQYADKRDSLELKDGQAYRTGLPAPVWSVNAAPTVTVDPYSAVVSYPQATDNDCVFRYRTVLKDATGRVVTTKWDFSGFFLGKGMPDTLRTEFTDLKQESAYSVEITAYDSYDNPSEQKLTAQFVLPKDTDPANFPPSASGRWTFDDENDPMQNSAENSAMELKRVTVDGTTVTPNDNMGRRIEGPKDGNGAFYVPKNGAFEVMTGTEDTIRSYTVQMDIRTEAVNVWNALLQANPDNADDADLFVNKSGKFGNGSYGYYGSLQADRWTRLVFVVDNGAPTIYVNGEKQNTPTSSYARLLLTGGKFYLFSDDDGEMSGNDVAEITFWDKALTARQVGNMGKIATNDYLTTSTPEIKVYDNNLQFDIILSSTVEPSFELPEWIHAVDATPVIGDNIVYTFRCDTIEEGNDERADNIYVNAPEGSGLDYLEIPVVQIWRGDVVKEKKVADWTFENAADLLKNSVSSSDYALTTGKSGDASFTECSLEDAGITEIEGPTTDKKAIAIPKLTGFKLKNGTGEEVNTYTCMMDIRINQASWYGLFQSDPANENDAAIFIKSAGSIGLNVAALGYGGNVSLGTWHRIVWTVREGTPAIYVDGALAIQGKSGSTRWNIQPDGAMFFCDNNGEVNDIEVARIALWSDFFTADQVKELGSVK